MTTRIVTDSNGRKHITNEPLLHPPQRTWVGLTDREMMDAIDIDDSPMEMGRKIEAKLKEKNS
jgi:hypothetical protein